MYDHSHHYNNSHVMNNMHHTSRVNSMSNSLPPAPMMANSQHIPPPPLPGPNQMSEGCGRSEGRTYELVVYQQPIRARMCGFGDKDRRPITPPPCARLIVRDELTGKEVDINEIDTSFFVLTVDLWSGDATKEVNLVKHSASSPSISSAVSSSYPPPPPTPPLSHPHQYPPQQHPQHPQQHMYPPSQYQGQPYSSYNGTHQGAPPSSPPQPSQGYYQQGPPQPYGNSYLPPPMPNQAQPITTTQQNPAGLFTRNLIGSLCASAFKLTDPDNKIGVWFILQDLSVRTEGTFRLKMNFVNVGANGALNTSGQPVPILASVFSSQFQVYSAKKFPGVIESTELSKCFATQGIKIPIRKDGPKALSRGQDEDEYD